PPATDLLVSPPVLVVISMVRPLRTHVAQWTENPLADSPNDGAMPSVPAKMIPDTKAYAGGATCVNHHPRGLCFMRHRLFRKDVFARPCSLQRLIGMQSIRCGDYYGVKIGIIEQILEISKDCPRGLCSVTLSKGLGLT